MNAPDELNNRPLRNWNKFRMKFPRSELSLHYKEKIGLTSATYMHHMVVHKFKSFKIGGANIRCAQQFQVCRCPNYDSQTILILHSLQ